MRCWNDEWLRKIAGPAGVEGEFHRERRGQGAARKILNGQIWITPDELDPEEISCWDVALRWTTEAVRSTRKSRAKPHISEAISLMNAKRFEVSLEAKWIGALLQEKSNKVDWRFADFSFQNEAVDVDIDEILDMDTDEIRRSYLFVSLSVAIGLVLP